MTQIDIQYLHQISPKLDRFKKKSQNLYNFRCPYCGDSKKKKSKARGFVYRVKNDMFYKCHNCGKGTTVGKLIEYVDPQSYKQWIVDKYKSGNTHSTKEPEFKFKPVKFDDKVLKGLISFDKLHDHPSYTYLTKRKIPKEHFSSLYFCPKFMTWVNTLIPNKFPNITKDYPRIVIPFFDINKKVFAFQGRAFGEEEPKYITIKLDENKKRIYGLDRLDVTKKIYVVEGPIDSLFLPNAIAVAGADLEIPKLKNQAVYIFDNEPRNKVVIDKVEKLILKNYNVCIWPKTIKEKDINELILSGYNSPEIQSLIDSNTFSKLSAIQQLNDYKEV
jgi:transcription elongation factor Elf1|tara:strand:+ start:1666 stop:2658 length:993 start_codon:yes stop_codon:yes gene_type:complete